MERDGYRPPFVSHNPDVQTVLSAGLPLISVDAIALRGLAPHLHLATQADQFVTLARRALRGELRANLADATGFRDERVWDRVVDKVVGIYDEILRHKDDVTAAKPRGPNIAGGPTGRLSS
jgi:hypothetical protein